MTRIELRRPGVRAVIDPVGAGLQSLVLGGMPLVESYERHAADGGAPGASGATLFPWANRVRDGRWQWGGEDLRLRVNEPERRTANHGLVRTRVFDVAERTPRSVTLRARTDGEPGYPFSVRIEVTYLLRADGIEVAYTVLNEGTAPAPVAVGAHPYLRIGDRAVDELMLHVAADTVLDVDERLLPTTARPVRGTPEDPRNLPLRGRRIHHCYGDLETEAGGHVHRLRAPDGTVLELRTDARFGWVQVYTAADFPRGSGDVRAIAVEPMTAPPDALNSKTDLYALAPAETWRAQWALGLATAGA